MATILVGSSQGRYLKVDVKHFSIAQRNADAISQGFLRLFPDASVIMISDENLSSDNIMSHMHVTGNKILVQCLTSVRLDI